MSSHGHPLHERIAEIISKIAEINNPSDEIIIDTACMFETYHGEKQTIPFFLSYRPSRESAVSQVDIVLLKNNKIKLVCEIEESGFNPTKIFGKLFSTASAKRCRLGDGQFLEFDNNATFLQIISTKKFPEKSLKEKQGQLIENEINNHLQVLNSWIKNYRLIYGEMKNFNENSPGFNEIERIIQSL